VNIGLDGLANDGARDERDNVRTDVEGVRGTRFDDVLSGNPDPNNSDQNRLYGGTGNDWLVGGQGADALFGEAGGDVLSAVDGLADTWVDCGTGSDETAYADVIDPVTECEVIWRTDDGR
jgi:Ca2+-binding RTX toxin-like protein